MEIKIYIDVLLFVNMIFNYLLLWLTGLLLEQKVSAKRLLFAAFSGALYAVFAFFLPDSSLYGLAGKLLAGALMAAFAYRPRTMSLCIKYICVFYASVFILSGVAFAFFYFSDSAASLGAIYRNGTLYINLPIYLLLLLCLFCFVLLKISFAVGGRISATRKRITRIKVMYKNKTATLRAYYDSGNLLRDEISGKSVLIAQWDGIKSLFDNHSTLKEALKQEKDLIHIAYRTLQGSDVLPAFLPDEMYMITKTKIKKLEPVYIGLVEETLDYYNTWDAILPHNFQEIELQN